MPKDFAYYRDCFANLHTAKHRGHPAPHKPLLLLAVIDLVEHGVITDCRVPLSDNLSRAFKANADRFLGHSVIFHPNIGTPFFHLSHEPFWTLIPVCVNAEPALSSYSTKSLRAAYRYASIDTELFELLQNQDARAKLRTVLISTYLSSQPNSVAPALSIPLILSIVTALIA